MMELCLAGGLVAVVIIGAAGALLEKKMELALKKDSELRRWRERARQAETELETLLHRIPAAECHFVRLRDEENEALRAEILRLEKEKEELGNSWAAKYSSLETIANKLWPNSADQRESDIAQSGEKKEESCA